MLACASTWEAQSPHDIIAMASDSKKRFVESSQQLLDVILESLSHLQAELHGELASVGGSSGIVRMQTGGLSKRKMFPTMWHVI